MKKTFKIGEYALGGIIEVNINKGVVDISVKDWDTKEELRSRTTYPFDEYRMRRFLELEITTPYYTDKVIEYIKKKLC